MTSSEPILDVAGGDIGLSRHLTRSLRTLADKVPDPRLKSEIRSILAGQGSVRDLVRNEAFNRILDDVMPTMLRRAQQLSEDELKNLAEQGRRELDGLRAQPEPPLPAPRAAAPAATPPAPASPPVRRELPPEVVEADDEYFRERNQRGWLV